MSHITKIGLQIKDLDAPDKACRRLGLELVRGQKTMTGYSVGQCEHVVRVKDAVAGTYEIGLVKRADGKGYELQWDGHMGPSYAPAKALYERVGYSLPDYGKAASTNKLRDWYAAEVARKQMARQGFMVKTVQQQGKVQVLCSK